MKKNIQVIVVVAAFIGAVVFAAQHFMGGKEEDSNYWRASGQHIQCGDCGAVATFADNVAVNKAMDETLKEHPEAFIPECTACGGIDGARVFICPHCEQAIPQVGHGSLPEICPECNEALSETEEVG